MPLEQISPIPDAGLGLPVAPTGLDLFLPCASAELSFQSELGYVTEPVHNLHITI